jgi:DTW domain-containing protein
MSREKCIKCFRPIGVCLCSAVLEIDCPYSILVLQHTKEVAVYNNTVSLMGLCLKELKVFVGERWEGLASIGLSELDNCFLIFPGKDAVAISNEKASFVLNKNQKSSKVTFILIDGTWRQAKRMFRENKWLEGIPKFSFDSGVYLSNYTIRKEPVDGFLSTLEAVVYSVREASQNEKWGWQLLVLLQKMVDKQLKFDPRKIR